MVGQISQQLSEYTYEIVQQQINTKTQVNAMRNQFIEDSVSHVKQAISNMLRNVDLTSEKGASIWLTCLRIEEFGFSLHKRAFMDALALCYGWPVKDVPVSCSCGASFTISHVLSCPKGGFPSLRHNESEMLQLVSSQKCAMMFRLSPIYNQFLRMSGLEHLLM